jgi:hypothetical protein
MTPQVTFVTAPVIGLAKSGALSAATLPTSFNMGMSFNSVKSNIEAANSSRLREERHPFTVTITKS